MKGYPVFSPPESQSTSMAFVQDSLHTHLLPHSVDYGTFKIHILQQIHQPPTVTKHKPGIGGPWKADRYIVMFVKHSTLIWPNAARVNFRLTSNHESAYLIRINYSAIAYPLPDKEISCGCFVLTLVPLCAIGTTTLNELVVVKELDLSLKLSASMTTENVNIYYKYRMGSSTVFT
jgi:hypothetical protein